MHSTKLPSALYGILFMLINTVALAGLDIAAKILRVELHSGLIIFLYKFSLFIVILPWVLREGMLRLKTRRIWFHVFRSVFGVIGAICFYHGLHYVDMADAAALENVQYVIVSVIGLIFFHEKAAKYKVLAIVLGFLGAVIVVNPTLFSNFTSDNPVSMEWNTKHLFIIVAITFWSCNTIIVKLLGNTEHNKTQMFYLLLFTSIFAAPAAFFTWHDVDILGYQMPFIPSIIDITQIAFRTKYILLIGFMAICYFIHGVAYFNALKSELSVVIPFRYSKLIFSGVLGFLLFGEMQEENFSYVGYLCIILSGIILFFGQLKEKAALLSVALSKPKSKRRSSTN